MPPLSLYAVIANVGVSPEHSQRALMELDKGAAHKQTHTCIYCAYTVLSVCLSVCVCVCVCVCEGRAMSDVCLWCVCRVCVCVCVCA